VTVTVEPVVALSGATDAFEVVHVNGTPEIAASEASEAIATNCWVCAGDMVADTGVITIRLTAGAAVTVTEVVANADPELTTTDELPTPAAVIVTIVPLVADSVTSAEFPVLHVNGTDTGLLSASYAWAVRLVVAPTFRSAVVGVTVTRPTRGYAMVVLASDDRPLPIPLVLYALTAKKYCCPGVRPLTACVVTFPTSTKLPYTPEAVP